MFTFVAPIIRPVPALPRQARLQARLRGLAEHEGAHAAQAQVDAEDAALAQEQLLRLNERVKGLEDELAQARADKAEDALRRRASAL